MPQLILDVPDELQNYLERQAVARGLGSAADYVQSRLLADQTAKAKLDGELHKGFDSGEPQPISPEDWEELRTRSYRSKSQETKR